MRDVQVLEGVTQLLSQIGDEVGERVPGGQIEPGQSYTFDVQVRTLHGVKESLLLACYNCQHRPFDIAAYMA